MSSEWIPTTIGDQATLQRGFDITKAQQREGSIPVISSGGTNSYHDAAAVKGPGVVLGRKGVVGSVYFVNKDFWPHDTTLWVKDFHGNDALFVYYFFRSRAADLAALDVGSANPTLNRNHVHPIKTAWPPLSEQRKIAELLGALDDRIYILRETNATLEAIAQALFKSWFIDFDPVRARLEGRAPEAVNEATAAFFPDGFVESELGLTPRGWRVGVFGDLAVQVKGSVNPLDTPSREFEHYSLPAFDAHRLPVVELGASIKSNKTRMCSGVVLQSKLNPHIPRVWYPQSVGTAAVCSTEFLPWLAKAPASPEVVYCLLQSTAFEAEVRTLVTGTSNSHQRVKPDQIASLRTVIATAETYEAFTNTVRPLLQRVAENWQLCGQLAVVRDGLLPRLISGQLRLPEAEALAA